MQSFEAQPQPAPEERRALVKPYRERTRKPRFIDPQMEEEAMPDTKRTGAARPQEAVAKQEDTTKVEQIQEQIKTPEAASEVQTLTMYADTSISRAENTLKELQKAAGRSTPDMMAFQEARNKLLVDLNYLLDLQRYTISKEDSRPFSDVQQKVHEGIKMIQEGIYKEEQLLRERAVAKNWGTDKPWASEERARIRNTPVDAESAALAGKFNASAKAMEAQKQKKSLWSRFKGLFS